MKSRSMGVFRRVGHFFKPTWGKTAYTSIFTLFPYILAYILVGWQNDRSGWGVGFFRLIVVIGTPPLWFIAPLLPFDNDTFFFYLYPGFSFLAWYLLSCTITSIKRL